MDTKLGTGGYKIYNEHSNELNPYVDDIPKQWGEIVYRDFIMSVDNFISPDDCQDLIDIWHRYKGYNSVWDRSGQIADSLKMDDRSTTINMSENHMDITDMADSAIEYAIVMKKIWSAFNLYHNKWSLFPEENRPFVNFYNFVMKVQKTEPNEGYHVWHYENSSQEYAQRVLAWTIYLNDVEEGGETEFLHQSYRAKPKAGKLVLWPAGFTHLHRGNPPLSGTKWLATGWITQG